MTERIRAGSLTAYRYDKNGSLISEKEGGKETAYGYDLLNRQITVSLPDGRKQENLYDGENLRAGLLENGKKTIFLFHNGEILAESEGESAPIRRYLRGQSQSLCGIEESDTGLLHSYHQDEQGSTAYITGQDRAVENFYQYDAFGNLLENKESIENRILYTGQQYDQETGQYYLRARYYNPVVGRFLQEDTYRGDGLNLYAYCANNPVVYYDPSGHQQVGSCGSGDGKKPETTEVERINKSNSDDVIEVEISRSKYPESAKHIEDAIAEGKPEILTLNRGNAKNNRKESLQGRHKVPGMDLDEYPPAMSMEGGKGASVRSV